MGSLCFCCSSTGAPYDRDGAAINKRIEENLSLEQQRASAIHKMLLLGAGESGKSTLFKQVGGVRGGDREVGKEARKIRTAFLFFFFTLGTPQMNLIYGKNPFPEDERIEYTRVIHANIIESISTLITMAEVYAKDLLPFEVIIFHH